MYFINDLNLASFKEGSLAKLTPKQLAIQQEKKRDVRGYGAQQAGLGAVGAAFVATVGASKKGIKDTELKKTGALRYSKKGDKRLGEFLRDYSKRIDKYKKIKKYGKLGAGLAAGGLAANTIRKKLFTAPIAKD